VQEPCIVERALLAFMPRGRQERQRPALMDAAMVGRSNVCKAGLDTRQQTGNTLALAAFSA